MSNPIGDWRPPIMNNRLYNVGNPYQGDYKRVLCVCSAGLLRSPTAAVVLSQEPYNYNTRAVGIETEHALVPVDTALLKWADEIVVMTPEHKDRIEYMLDKFLKNDTHPKEVVLLDIPDSYAYRDPELIKLIKERYDASLRVAGEDQPQAAD